MKPVRLLLTTCVLLGHLVFWALHRMASYLDKINGDDAKFYKSKLATARFCFGRLFH